MTTERLAQDDDDDDNDADDDNDDGNDDDDDDDEDSDTNWSELRDKQSSMFLCLFTFRTIASLCLDTLSAIPLRCCKL